MSGIKVKGTGLISTRSYVKEMYAERYSEWLKSLPQKCQLLYSRVIDSSDWFNVEEMYYLPLVRIAEMFFGGNEHKAAIEVGKYSAEFGLKGPYKVFLAVSTPQFLMNASKRIISMYFKPVNVEITDVSSKSLIFTATRVYPKSEIIDYRAIGWCIRALELAGCRNVTYQTTPNEDPSEFSVKFLWE
ncbi:MAG: hypothetical protein AB7S48_07185 [Bacteroidales bacterium]